MCEMFSQWKQIFWLWFHATTFANWVLFNMIVRYRCKCISEVDSYVMQIVGYRLAGLHGTGNGFPNTAEMMLQEVSGMIYLILLCRNIYMLQIVVADIKTKYLGKNMHKCQLTYENLSKSYYFVNICYSMISNIFRMTSNYHNKTAKYYNWLSNYNITTSYCYGLTLNCYSST